MYKRYLYIVLLFLCWMLMTACGVYYDDLGSHYAWLESREIVRITEKSEDEESISYDEIIRPQVLNYAFDDNFIIAYQVYDESEFYDISLVQDKIERDSLLNQFSKLKIIKHCYWIINKNTHKVIGPMTQSEFNRRCNVMHIETEMKQFQEQKFIK